jgi:hypothetical protein
MIKKVYVIIPFISKNFISDEPYIILSKQILITNHSKCEMITNYMYEKISEAFKLYNFMD